MRKSNQRYKVIHPRKAKERNQSFHLFGISAIIFVVLMIVADFSNRAKPVVSHKEAAAPVQKKPPAKLQLSALDDGIFSGALRCYSVPGCAKTLQAVKPRKPKKGGWPDGVEWSQLKY